MKTLALTLALLVSVFAATAQAQAQTLLTPADFTLTDTRDVHFGGDTPYMSYLTHRYVGGELRFLTLTHRGVLIEFRPGAAGSRVTEGSITGRWANLPGLSSFNGLFWNPATGRLWVTSTVDYTTTTTPAHITMMTLNADGTVSDVRRVNLSGVNEKRVYGGCQPSPVAGFAYVCGWGGYTSLVAQGGGAAMGPSMVGIADPSNLPDGTTIPATTILDTPLSTRGVRRTIPVNYFDGGDADATGRRRENPQTRPSLPPYEKAGYLSPNAEGLGWFTWGDSYYNTGAFIDTSSKRGFVMVASLCGVPGRTQTVVGTATIPGAGACWYQTSTLQYDGRTAELHIFDPAQLGTSTTQRPASMTELVLPRGVPETASWSGNVPQLNVSGATYDATAKMYHLIVYPMADWSTGRLYSFAVADTGTPPPVTPPVVVPPVVVPPVTPPVVTPPAETITHADLKAILDRIEAAIARPPVQTFTATVTSVGAAYANGDRRLTIRVPLASMPTAPTNGATLRVVKE